MKRVLIAFAIVFALAVVPATAYTVILKDGSTIQTQKKYEIEGDKAILTLVGGTRSFIDASEIDVEASEKANVKDYGNAYVFQKGGFERMEEDHLDKVQKQRDPTLRDLLTSQQVQADSRPQRRRAPEVVAEGLPRTLSGNVDLQLLDKEPSGEPLAIELQGLLASQVTEGVAVFKGTQGKRLLVEATADSEAEVFRALRAAAGSLLTLQERQPGSIDAIELLILTSRGARSGQFLLFDEDARQLTAPGVRAADYFVRNVQF